MAIIAENENFKLKGFDAFSYRFNKEVKTKGTSIPLAFLKGMYQFVRPILTTKAQLIEIASKATSSKLFKSLKARKIKHGFVFPLKPAAFEAKVYPHDIPSQSGIKLYKFLEQFCHRLENKKYNIRQILTQVNRLEALKNEFHTETQVLADDRYLLLTVEGKRAPKPVKDTQENRIKHNLSDENSISLKQWREEAIGIIEGLMVQMAEKLVKKHTPKSAENPKAETNVLLSQLQERVHKCSPKSDINKLEVLIKSLNIDKMADDFDKLEPKTFGDAQEHWIKLDRIMELRDALNRVQNLSVTLLKSSEDNFKNLGKEMNEQITTAVERINEKFCPKNVLDLSVRKNLCLAMSRRGSNNNQMTTDAKKWLEHIENLKKEK